MSCVYLLDGHQFNSELELDDFLLSKSRFRSRLGDIVFQERRKTPQLDTADRLEERLEETEKLKEQKTKYNKQVLRDKTLRELYMDTSHKVISEERESINLKAPYVGVNAFLNGYINEEGKLLFPEFIADNYWAEQYDTWSKEGADEETSEFLTSYGLHTGDGETTFKNTDPQEQKKWRNAIEDKWMHQSIIGDVMHTVLQMYFKKINSKKDDGSPKYFKDWIAEDSKKALAAFKQQLFNKELLQTDGSKIKVKNYINDEQLQSALEICKKIEDELNIKYPDALYYPEYEITGKTAKPSSNGVDTILGSIDLLVVDKNGVPHIIDYKTSIHPYEKFDNTKKLAYTYQLLTYGRLIGKAGLNIHDSEYNVIPIQISNFQYTGGKFNYSGFNLKEGDNIFIDLRSEYANTRINKNLDEIIDFPYTVNVTADEMLTEVSKFQQSFWKKYTTFKQYTLEEAKKIAEANNAFILNDNGVYEFKPRYMKKGETIKVDPKTEKNPKTVMTKKVQEYLNNRRYNDRDRLITSTKKALNEAIKNKDINSVVFTGDIGEDWFSKMMGRYCSGNWEVCDGQSFAPLEALGIITLWNANNRQYNFVKISLQNIQGRFRFGSTSKTTLGGGFKSDVYFKSNPDSMMMDATYGNIELMETMFAINKLSDMFKGDNACVGDILVADPQFGIGVSAASNYELLKTFNELVELNPEALGVNNFKNGTIPMASKVQLARTMLTDVKIKESTNRFAFSKESSTLESAQSALDTALITPENVDAQINALQKVINVLETTDKNKELVNYTTNTSILAKEHVALYNQCILAIAELKGVHFRQQIKDHAAWVESINVVRDGIQGNQIDNPGNLQSETLNLITKLVTEAYQNVRHDIQKPANDILQFVELLKKEKNFGWLKENTVGNQASLYTNMYEWRDDDVYFKDPWNNSNDLLESEREFLKYALPIINKNRFGKKADQVRFDAPNKYFRIPICEGDTSVKAAKDGLLEAFKDRLKGWNPKIALQNARAKAGEFFDKDVEAEFNKNQKNAENLFKMTNMFDWGEGPNRARLVKRGKYELNLETLLLKHQFAYIMKDRIDAVFPLIKASMIHLTTQAFMNQNSEGKPFVNDLKYAEDYIKNKIRNESIIDEKFREANEAINKLKGLASTLVLGFSPVQFLYQSIQGIWNDISLIIRKPDGTDAFTLSNMLQAAKIVYADLAHYGDRPSLIESLNRVYGVNDMDMNSYIDHIKSDQNGLFNFKNMVWKFASRPDYYNRMTIFVAKMINEGSLDAHSIDENGNLVYDSSKDARYRAYLMNDRSDMKAYSKAKAYYIAAAKQFEKEGVLDANGNPFKYDPSKLQNLPRAYTNLEAESMKSLGDTIYGYYSHEKKSMMQATLWGTLFMQFKTYWSGKKNQYLATGGIKLEGNWKPYSEKNNLGEDVYYYYQKDENGNILYNEPPVKEGDPNASDAAVIRWEGNWKEGIISTMYQLSSNMYHQGFSDGWNSMWNNEDLNLRNAYRSNIKQLAYDTTMFLIVGNLIGAALNMGYKKMEDEVDKTNIGDALLLSALNIGIKSVRNSFLDFNYISSIGDPAVQWTPFSFEYLINQASNVWDVIMGDQNFWLGLSKTTSLFTQFKPVFNTLKEITKENG